MKNIFILLVILSNSPLFGQYIGFSPIDESSVSKWIPKIMTEYYGTYHFGDSEGESTLIIFHSGTEVIAQIKSGAWNANATDWLWLYDNLSNVNIDKNGQFSSDQYNGEFVFYHGDDERQKCLKVYNSWSGVSQQDGEYELGWKLNPTPYEVYSGKYVNASTTELEPSELAKMSSDKLRIMRNEIFARYGYKFKEGGEMDTYFKKQSWYKAQHTDVNDFLTELEKRNIQLIRSEEQRL